MTLKNWTSEKMDVVIPDKNSIDHALKRTTHMVVAAHQDDIEIMAFHGIAQCYDSKTKWLTGVTLTSGGSSPRKGRYRKFSSEEMKLIRKKEQNKAALLGKYGLMIQMGFESQNIKNPRERKSIAYQLEFLFSQCQPEIVYTHNLADKHDTHVAVALATIQALRALPKKLRPKKLLGCEVWRDLDWMNDNSKVVLPVSENPKLALKLCRVFDSQISGGKRYDLGAIGRRQANATFFESSRVDEESQASFAMDLTSLLQNKKDPRSLVQKHLRDFEKDIQARFRRLK